MTLNDLILKITAVLPSAQFDKDNNGQIIIYTDLTYPKDTESCDNSQLVPVEQA